MTFIKNLSGDADRNSQDKSNLESPSKELSLIYFYKALEDTYEANWRGLNYISPHCFLYLVDRLLIMTSSFQGFIVTTRSSYVEWMLSEESVVCPNITPVSGSQLSSLEEIYNFLALVVGQLLQNNWDTEEWIKRSQLNFRLYHPLLVLKLFVILCLLCLYSKKYNGLLLNLLEKGNAKYMLPKEFLDVLSQCKKRNNIDLSPSLLSDALSMIGDPLVTVSFGKNCPEKYRVSICLDMGVFHSKDDIIRVLFSRKGQGHQNSVKGNLTTSASVKHFSGGGDDLRAASRTPASTMTPSAAQNMNGHGLKMNWGVFGEISDALKTGVGASFLNTMSNAAKLKAEVDGNKKILTAAIAQFLLNHCDGEDRSTFAEANKMLEELEQLSSSFDISDKKRAINIQSVRELVKTLQSKRQKLEVFCNQPLVCKSLSAETGADSSNIDESHKEDVNQSKGEETTNPNNEKVDTSSNTVASKTQDGSANQEGGGKRGKANNNKTQKKTKAKGRRKK